MSKPIDNPTVKMTFDNAQFEKNVSSTMSSIEKLKQSLNFRKGKDSMTELSAAAGKVNMAPIGTQVEGVNAKFLAMATIAVSVLSSIATQAAQTGASIAKSLTIGPLIDGFQEYETNMNSIQTILANTQSQGTTLEEVNAALQNLNEYSDKTIYNFGQMAKNIGTFTAAGVDLDSSTNAIKGIANLAAISGSNSEQASSAMYQLSQALAAGKVGLIDWNSVVNAGMGGQVFKEALFETAKAMGTIADVPMDQSFTQWEEAGNSFRDSLQDGWITADVLSNTLQTFTGDLNDEQLRAIGYNDKQIAQFKELGELGVESATKVKTFTQLVGTVKEAIGTGWADSFKLVIGDFEQARTLFTGINNWLGKYISGTSDARNNLLQGWKFIGGRESLSQALLNGLAAIESILKPIKDAFKDVFPPATAVTLANLTNNLRDFLQGLILSESGAKKVKQIFTGVFSLFKIGVEIVKGIFGVFKTLGSVIFDLVASFSGAAGTGADFVTKLRQMLVEGGGIQSFFEKINEGILKFGTFLLNAKERLVTFTSGLRDSAGESKGFQEVIDSFSRFFEKLKESGGSIKKVFETITDTISNFFNKVKEKFSKTGDSAGSALSDFIDKISDSISPDTFDKVFAVLSASFLGGIAIFLGKIVKDGIGINVFSDLVDSATEAFDRLGGALQAFTANQRSDLLMKIAIAVGVLTASLLVLSLIDPAKLGKALAGLGVGVGILVGALYLFTSITAKPFQFASLASSMVLIAAASLILSASIAILSRLSWAELAKGLVGVTGALIILAKVAEKFGETNGSFIKTSFSIIILSGALWAFSKVITTYANLPIKDVVKGLGIIAIALSGFVAFMKNIDGSDFFKAAGGVLVMAGALFLLSVVVSRFGNLDTKTLIQGLLSVAVTLGLLIAFFKLMPEGKEMVGKTAGILAVSIALGIMTLAVEKLAALKLTDLLKGLAGVAFLLAAVVIAANTMNGSIAGAGAIVIMAGALWVMAEVLEKIGNLGLGKVLVGLLGLAGVLVILGLAAAALVAFPPLLGALTGMASALLLIGAGFALLGAGAYLAAKAIEVLVGLGDKAAEAITNILKALASAVPDIAAAAAGGIIAFATTLAEQADTLLDAIGDILSTLVDELIELLPKIGELISEVISSTLDILEEHGPRIIDVGIMLITKLLTAIRDNAGNLAKIGLEIMVKLIEGISSGISSVVFAVGKLIFTIINNLTMMVPLLIQAGTNLIVSIIEGITSAVPRIVGAIGNFIVTMLTEIGKWSAFIIATGFNILTQILEGIGNGIVDVGQTVTDIMVTLIEEIGSWSTAILNTGIRVALDFLDGLVDSSIGFVNKAAKLMLKLLESIEAAIRLYSPRFRRAAVGIADAIIDGLTGGLSDKASRVINKIRDIAGDAIGKALEVFGINSPSRVFRDIGRGLNEGLALGIRDGSNDGPNAVKGIANSTVRAFGEAMSGIKYELENMSEFNPTITPVLDLTKVGKDARNLSGLLGTAPLAANLSSAQAAYLASAQRPSPSDSEVASQANPTSLIFEQVINSPKPLSANDIYRGTRSQIATAKEALGIS